MVEGEPGGQTQNHLTYQNRPLGVGLYKTKRAIGEGGSTITREQKGGNPLVKGGLSRGVGRMAKFARNSGGKKGRSNNLLPSMRGEA